jgi:cephalosporin hydroxylase
MAPDSALPAPARVALLAPLRELWLQRIHQLLFDSYLGVPMHKLPEDLRVYEHLMWESGCDTVIELGTNLGGSALWFRDRLATLAAYGRIERPRVITVDMSIKQAHDTLGAVDPDWRDTITLVEGDVCDPSLPDEVHRLLPATARCLVSEDTAHTTESTLAALRGFAQFVPAGGFFVVEDGFVDVEEMRPDPDWPRGVQPAIAEWLADEGRDFRLRPDLALYGLTCHVQGYLQRVT